MENEKHCINIDKIRNSNPLPIVYNRDGTVKKFTAHFNGYSIVIDNYKQMEDVNTMGTFGKGTLSRNYPANPEQVEILRERVFTYRKQRFKQTEKPRKVLVVPDSDEETDEYFVNLNVKYEIDKCGLVETLNLSLEEGFFLLNDVQCLEVTDGSETLNSESAWRLFQQVDKNFARNYVVYYHYRSRNWIVKVGIKFGGDFVLYKGSPQLYHANYLVLIDVVDNNNVRYDDMVKSYMEIKYLHGVNRLCETAGKELLICQLVWPRDLEIRGPDDISKISIKEVIMKRWISDGIKDDDEYFLCYLFIHFDQLILLSFTRKDSTSILFKPIEPCNTVKFYVPLLSIVRNKMNNKSSSCYSLS